MTDRLTYRPVYKALHRPLTICGVDRRLFFLALLLGAATFNLFYSLLAGVLMGAGLYGLANVLVFFGGTSILPLIITKKDGR